MTNEKTEDQDTGPVSELEHLEATMATTRERVEDLIAQTKMLETMVKRARGTGEITQQVKTPSLPGQIESVLRRRILTTEELARALQLPVAHVAACLTTLRTNVIDIGTPEQARWTWRLEPGATTEEVKALVRRLISDQPMTLRDLIRASGVREGLVQGALVELRRTHPEVLNLGNSYRGRWFLPVAARPAYLGPKRSP